MESYGTGKGISTQTYGADVYRGKTQKVERQHKEASPGYLDKTGRSEEVILDVSQNKMRVYREVMQKYGETVSCNTMSIQEETVPATEIESDVAVKEENTDTTAGELLFMETLLESMKESRENAKSSENTTKSLGYSYRKISTAILRAKNLNQAGNALVSAKANVSALKRKAASGQYHSEEVQIAISHAKKMVNTAKKKVRHLQQEVRLERAHHGKEKQVDLQHKKEQKQKREWLEEQKLQDKKQLELIKTQGKQKRKQTKNSHRRTEGQELLEADMEYLRRQIQWMEQKTGSYEPMMTTPVNGMESAMEMEAVSVESLPGDSATP